MEGGLAFFPATTSTMFGANDPAPHPSPQSPLSTAALRVGINDNSPPVGENEGSSAARNADTTTIPRGPMEHQHHGQSSIARASLNAFLTSAYHAGAGSTGDGGGVSASLGRGGHGGGVGAVGAGYVGGDAPLRQLIEAKERELHEIHDFRIRSLEALLEEREASLADSYARYDKLKEDFKFNLGLIEDRDAELGRYEATLQGLKECLRDKEVEASELKMRLDENLSVHRQAEARQNEQQAYWQAKCKVLRDEADGLRWAREEEARAAREREEVSRATLTRQLREREDELESQRADAAEAFDRLMQQRQDETQARVSEMTNQIREAESRSAEQARQRERAEREAVGLRDASTKLRQALDEAEKTSRGLRWELEDRRQIATAEVKTEERVTAASKAEDAAKAMEEMDRKHEAALAAGEDRVREVLSSLHAVEKAFVQHKDRHESDEKLLRERGEELRTALEACRERVHSLEQAVADGGEREDELRGIVRKTREEHQREAAALRKKLSEHEAAFRRETDNANNAAAALQAANLSLEGVVADLEEREASLKKDLREEGEKRSRIVSELERNQRCVAEEAERLRGELSSERQSSNALAEELALSKRLLEEQDEAAGRERFDMQEALVRLQQQLLQADKINAGGSAPRQHKGGGNDGGSPLFSDDQGVPSPLPPPMAFAGTGSAADGCAESTQEVLELQAANLRLRGVVADMRKEMEGVREPAVGADREGSRDRERQRLGEENEDLRVELSAIRGELQERVRGDGGGASREMEEKISRLQDRCENLQGEVDRLTAERDKLMDIGNGLRAELNRALSSSYQPDETALQAKVEEAVSRAQRETRRKYRARVSEVEAAFAQLAADNRRLKAKVGQLSSTSSATRDDGDGRGRGGDDGVWGDGGGGEGGRGLVGGNEGCGRRNEDRRLGKSSSCQRIDSRRRIDDGRAYRHEGHADDDDGAFSGGGDVDERPPNGRSRIRVRDTVGSATKSDQQQQQQQRRSCKNGDGSSQQRKGHTRTPSHTENAAAAAAEGGRRTRTTTPSANSSAVSGNAGKNNGSINAVMTGGRRVFLSSTRSTTRHAVVVGKRGRNPSSGKGGEEAGDDDDEEEEEEEESQQGEQASPPPLDRRSVFPRSTSERQTEGQRAAALRLRAWQQRRRLGEDGGGGITVDSGVGGVLPGNDDGRSRGHVREVRPAVRVRNYNIRDNDS